DEETTEQLKDLLKRQGEQNVENHANKDKVTNLQAEVDRLRRQVHILQQESADKEVKIVQLNKKHDNAMEDLSQMNMALDSKQQELELLKRKHQVRGTAGSTSVANTPAPARRRDSAIFSTPSTSRPSSMISNSSDKETPSTATMKERKLSSEGATVPKVNTLAKSTRVNGTMGPPSTSKPRLSSMGMGPANRMSIGGTPTPAGRVSSFSISSSSGTKSMPSAPTTIPSKEPGKSTLAELQEDEKENRDVDATPSSPQKDRRRSMIPTPA
ncbi:hypothetical protein GYMLUDRAFT_111598, partial [Collybiopsis luxurians FD-317 M1]